MQIGGEAQLPLKHSRPASQHLPPYSGAETLNHTVHSGLEEGSADSPARDAPTFSFSNNCDFLKGNLSFQSSNLKVYKCEICGYEATRNYNLMRHMRTHTGERLRCPCCERTFIDTYKLKYHLKTHGQLADDTGSEHSALFMDAVDTKQIDLPFSYGK